MNESSRGGTARRAALRRLGAVTAAGALLGGSVFAQPAFAQPAPEGPTEHTDLGLTGDAIYQHLAEIAEISEQHSDEGYRAVGTPGYEAAGQYVEQALEATGAFEVERQVFTVPSENRGPIELSVEGEEITETGHLSNAEGTSEPLVDVPLALPAEDAAGTYLGCTAEDFADVPAGSIILIERGECTFEEKVVNATAADAAAVLIFNNAEGVIENATVGERNEDNAPTAALSQAAGQQIRDLIVQAAEAEEDAPTASLSIEKDFEPVETFNILADTTAGDADEVVVIGAHLDGVTEGPGVNDNGSGSAALLALADQIADYEFPNDKKIRLAFWGAEEIGLIGSSRYVEDLQNNDPAELERIQAYLNYDMIGSNNYTVGVYDADQSTFPEPEDVTIPDGSVELEQIYTDYFDSVDQPWVDSEYSGRSDYQAFIEADIPSGGLFSGADSIKTEEEEEIFGGTAGLPLDTNYHQPTDTLENVNQESLGIFAPAIGWSAHVLAWDLVDEQPTPEPTPTEEPTSEPTPTEEPTSEPTPGPTSSPTDPPVSGGDPRLPRTGADVVPLAAAALFLIAMGTLIAGSTKARYRRS